MTYKPKCNYDRPTRRVSMRFTRAQSEVTQRLTATVRDHTNVPVPECTLDDIPDRWRADKCPPKAAGQVPTTYPPRAFMVRPAVKL